MRLEQQRRFIEQHFRALRDAEHRRRQSVIAEFKECLSQVAAGAAADEQDCYDWMEPPQWRGEA